MCKEDLENKSKEGQNIEEEEREKRAKLQTKQEKTGELAKKKQEKELGVWERGLRGKRERFMKTAKLTFFFLPF